MSPRLHISLIRTDLRSSQLPGTRMQCWKSFSAFMRLDINQVSQERLIQVLLQFEALASSLGFPLECQIFHLTQIPFQPEMVKQQALFLQPLWQASMSLSVPQQQLPQRESLFIYTRFFVLPPQTFLVFLVQSQFDGLCGMSSQSLPCQLPALCLVTRIWLGMLCQSMVLPSCLFYQWFPVKLNQHIPTINIPYNHLANIQNT